MDKLTGLVAIILALSVASERLVEIVKGFFSYLNTQDSDAKAEGRRRSILQILAVGAGVFTAFLARSYISIDGQQPAGDWSILGLGLLASGGSGFWNAAQTYLAKAKDVQSAKALQIKKETANM